MIALVEGAQRQKTPNEIALNILLASLTIVFLLATVTLQPMAIYSGGRAVDHRARRPARVPDPDHDRGAPLRDRHRGDGPARAAQRPRDVGAGRRGRGRREHPPAGQDRHDHARQPPGGGVPPGPRRHGRGARRRGSDHQPRRRDARGSIDRGAGEGAVRAPRPRPRGRDVRAVHGADTDERRRRRRPAAAQGRRRFDPALGRGAGWVGAGGGRHDRRRHLGAGRHAADGGGERPRARGRLPQGHREGRDAPAIRRAPTDGHQDRHDHRRQPQNR